jgi:DNA repair protein SbcC/Rad50
MRLVSIELEGIRSYHAAQKIPLDGVRAAAVIGKNGAGKSTILTAVLFALYGMARGADEFLSTDSDKGQVTLVFEIDGTRYKVARGRERGKKPWLSIATQADGTWTPIRAHTIAQTQQALDSIIGMSEDVFCASVMSPQGQAGRLIAMTPSQRKQLLGELLGLDSYETYRERVGADLRTLDRKLAIADDRIERLEAEISALGTDEDLDRELADVEGFIADATARVGVLERELDAALKREKDLERYRTRQQLTRQINDVVARGKALKTKRAALAAFEAEDAGDVDALNAAVAAATRARDEDTKRVVTGQGQLARLERERQIAYEKLQAADTVLRRAVMAVRENERQSADAQAEYERLEQAERPECPTCHQAIAGEAFDAVVKQLLEDIRRLSLEARELKAAHDAAAAEEQIARAQQVASVQAAREYKPVEPDPEIEAALADAIRARDEARERELSLAAMRASLEHEPTAAELRSRWEALRAERDALPLAPPAGQTVEDARRQLDAQNRSIADGEARRIAVRERASRRLQASEALGREVAAVRGDRDRREALSVLERAFSRNGVPAALLDGAVAGVEAAANEVLAELGSTFSVRLDTQRQLKSGGLGETLDIVVDDGMVERTLETFSGGEQYRVHVALRLGLARALGKRSMDCVLIDEVTDLDADGVRQLADMLTRLPGKQVLLVTHAEDLVDALPQKLVVSRDGPGSSSRVELLT